MNEDYRSKDVEAEMDETPSMEFNPRNFFKSFYHTSKAVLLSPKVFFAAMKKGGDFRGPFLYMAACVLFHVVIFGLLQKDPEIMLKTFFLGILFPFITAGILFGIVKRVFRAEGSYESAFRVNAYASAVNLVAWLPLVGLFFELYRVYLIVIGLSGAFSIRPSRSLLAVLITMAVYIMVSAAPGYL
ncbi:MAG: hypothetical protein B5M55_08150 [Desulfococcus sp. 4484_242]|nr:MAG: hypothetical protein B5M55_08150 [Desulfococcus sp. 4484_242]